MANDALAEAQRLYTESLAAHRDQRDQIQEDLAFSDPSNPEQWERDIKSQRENDPGGRRLCLVMDQLGQYTSQVTGQGEKSPPSIHAIPIGGGASKQAAEQIDGRFRHIEHISKAQQHYARALTSAARAGVGYMVVRPEYVDCSMGYQEPRISSEPDPMKVIFDPWSVETDGGDATFAYIMTLTAHSEFERLWGKKKRKLDFGSLNAAAAPDDRKSVLVAEQFYKEWNTQNVVIYTDESGQEQKADASEEEFRAAVQDSGMPFQFGRSYTDKRAKVWWRRMSGADILEEDEYPCDQIGVVPVYGYVGWSGGRMRYCGIPRRGRKPQQAYNYHCSELAMPGAQLVASKRALAGVQNIWDRAHVERRAFLPYNDMDADGPVSPPTLLKIGSSLIDHAGGAERALRDIQAAIGMYQANLGAPSNETSGVAIESRKEQGESSTAHFPSHMAASVGRVGEIVMQMDARLIGKSQRKQPILGVDGSSGSVMVDPDQEQAFRRLPDGGGCSINPSVGSYGVMVVAGASYSTQRTQTNAAFGEIMRGNPELAPTVAPFWAQTLDFPGSDKFAQAMGAMAPPPIKAILQPEGEDSGPDPAAMAQQMQQLQQALQEAIQHAHDAQEDADKALAAAAEAKRAEAAKAAEIRIKAYEAKTGRKAVDVDLLKVTGANEIQVQALVREAVEQMLRTPEQLPGDPEPGPDAWQSQIPEDAGAVPPEESQELPEGGEMPGEDDLSGIEQLQHAPGQNAIAGLQQTIQQLIETLQQPRKIVRGPDGKAIGIQ